MLPLSNNKHLMASILFYVKTSTIVSSETLNKPKKKKQSKANKTNKTKTKKKQNSNQLNIHDNANQVTILHCCCMARVLFHWFSLD